MPVKVQCPQCSKTLQIQDANVGKQVRCPACKNVFRAEPPEDAVMPASEVEEVAPAPVRRRPAPPPEEEEYEEEEQPRRRRRRDEDEDDEDLDVRRRPRRQMGWLDHQFADTNIVILVLFSLCCGIIALVFGIAGVAGCSDPVAKRNAWTVLIISLISAGVGATVSILQQMAVK
jgi:phage FluMu protein Com